jgi:CubicO group peptidase (beta-lactamase class C family)
MNFNHFLIRTVLRSLAFLCLSLQSVTAQTPTFIKDSLDIYIEREMKKWQVPGLAVAIVKDGKIVVQKGYGLRNIETAAPVDEHTLFMIASNSKIFAGTLLAIAEEEGHLTLQDTVQKWLPDFQLADPEISRRVNLTDLVTHRLGFTTFQGDFLHWSSTLSPQELVYRMRFIPLTKPFRNHYGYCNVGFIAAGLVLEKATGKDWHTSVKERILNPLDMNRTTTTLDGITTDQNAALPYTLINHKLLPLEYPNLNTIGPAASLNASVSDISKWLLMQLDNGRYNKRQVIPEAVIQKTRNAQNIVRDVRSPIYPSKHIQMYGLGWFMSDYAGKWVLDHGGGADGFVTTTAIIPDAGLGIAVFTNSDQNSLYAALKNQIIDAYLGLPYQNYSDIFLKNALKNRDSENNRLDSLKREIKEVIPTENQNAMLTGSFKHPHIGYMNVSRNDDGVLQIRFKDLPHLTATLSPLGNYQFLCDYNIATYGSHAIRFDHELNVWHIKVNDFVDYESYAFKRVN